MDLTIHVWRQPAPGASGKMVQYEAKGINEHSSFLEMLDVLNSQLAERGEEPIAFDHDCREGICAADGVESNAVAHGSMPGTTVCQLQMPYFKPADTLIMEP